MARQVSVGVVGLGGPGHLHAYSVLESGIGHLEAVCDLSDSRRENFDADYRTWTKSSPPVVRKVKELDELLASPAIDAIVVALPNFLHYPASLKALQAGKHVLCEKPPTLNAAQMRELHEEASRRGLVYFFGRQMRFDASSQAARQIIGERKLGEVYFVEALWIRSRGTPVGIDGWFTDRARAGGGALIDLGVHAIDTGWFLMGTPRPKSVVAQTYQKFPQLVKAPVFDVEDSAYGMIRFESGAIMQFQISWAANLFLDVPRSAWGDREIFRTTLYGPLGSIRVIDPRHNHPGEPIVPLTMVQDKDGKVAEIEVPLKKTNERSFVPQMRNFLSAVLDKEAPTNSSIQAVELMDMLDAVYHSTHTGREVVIGEG